MNTLTKVNIAIILLILTLAFFLLGTKEIPKDGQFNDEALNKSANEDSVSIITEHNEKTLDKIKNPNFPYWSIMPITYQIDPENFCGKIVNRRLSEAFFILENETENILSFNEVNNTGLIIIHCFANVTDSNISGSYIAGEGSPIISEDMRIIGGNVNLYNAKLDNHFSGGCTNYPDTELHELLHVFGFGHFDWRVKKSIMNDGTGPACIKLDKEIISCLKYIYSNGEKGSNCTGIPSILK